MLTELRRIEQAILAVGKVESKDLELLRQAVYAGPKIERPAADLLVELHKRVQHRTPAFEKFFYQAVKDHILAKGKINSEECSWLRRLVFANGKIEDEERKLMHELKGESKQASPEFDALFGECMKAPSEQHTCGG